MLTDAQVDALEKSNARLKEIGVKNNQTFKGQIQRAQTEAAETRSTLEAIQQQLASVTAERDALHTQTTAVPSLDAAATLTAQVDALTNEKLNLEKQLAEAKAVATTSSTEPKSDQEAVIVSHLSHYHPTCKLTGL
jgi:DNA repair exonuclease SbcCD ATPase subunit